MEASSASSNCVAELWTDVEFLTLSYSRLGSLSPTKGSYHELDIVIVEAGSNGRPPHSAVWLGIECKNTSYQKGLLKEILGVRRELSLVTSEPIKTKFSTWPRPYAPANPPSCLVVFATDTAVLEYSDPGEVFGIDFIHEPM